MLKELKTQFAQQAEQELLPTTRDFHSCRQEEAQSVSSYVLQMKGYIDNLERLGHPVTLGLGHGKTVNELHAMLKSMSKLYPKAMLLLLMLFELVRSRKYLAKLMKKKKNTASGAGGSSIFVIELNTILNRSWIYDTGCGIHICNTTQSLRASRKLKPRALSLYKKWPPNENLLNEDVSIVLVWVILHGVPVTAFSEDVLSAIATKLGVGEKKTVMKPCQASLGVPVGPKICFKPQKEYRPVPKKPNASSSGNNKKGVEPTIEVTKDEGNDGVEVSCVADVVLNVREHVVHKVSEHLDFMPCGATTLIKHVVEVGLMAMVQIRVVDLQKREVVERHVEVKMD
nr:zinc finger, CCHC-type [Tanacetum cinerariifolium]